MLAHLPVPARGPTRSPAINDTLTGGLACDDMEDHESDFEKAKEAEILLEVMEAVFQGPAWCEDEYEPWCDDINDDVNDVARGTPATPWDYPGNPLQDMWRAAQFN